MAKTASREAPAPPTAEDVPVKRSLHAAKAAKQDEFYTQYVDIQKEVEAYLEFDADTFRGKVVYCNCDDPFESNFFKYFAANFNKLGLKKLITTSYDGSPIAGQLTLFPEYNEGNGKRQKPKALAVIVDHVKDEDGDGAANVTDVELFLKRNKAARTALKADEDYPGGDFRSAQCIALLKEADVVVTNPPFSLFREYVAQLVQHGKKFLIIGPKNAITYKELFPLIKDTKLWLGTGFANGNAYFSIPEGSGREFAEGVYDESTGLVKFRNVGWFTNLDHGRRHEELPLMSTADNLKFSKHKEIKGKAAYDQYNNFDAIEVPYIDAIPSDHDGMMGVPVTFLDKYNPDQFEIMGYEYSDDLRTKHYPTQIQVDKKGMRSTVTKLNDVCALRVDPAPLGQTYYIVNGEYFVAPYKRLFIRHRAQPARSTKK
ncbi:adenine-specific methyltransferase EcoRI family protein [Mesorhizobium sp. M0213]|uniref:adenine-specific methyltransferase EcoRI family protein n=1 Tax=Mesorhizobium sp. M0213 TaxID=2956917 RepID=UPI003338B525